MRLVNLTEVTDGVYQLRVFRLAITVLVDGDGVALVDAGPQGSLRFIDAGLRELDISLEQVRLVILTHYHADHSGGIAKLAEATSAKVMAHRLEAEIMSGKGSLPSPFRNPFLAGLTQPLTRVLSGEPTQVDYLLEDGDRLPISEEVRVVHTPGHTPGSICLYIPAKKVLIVGDALQYRFRRLSLPASAVTQDPMQARESLKKLLALDFDVICFSHFPPLERNAQATLRRLVEKTMS